MIVRFSTLGFALVGPVVAASMLAGCRQTTSAPRPPHPTAQLLDGGSTAKLNIQQKADVQFALGRTLEESNRLEEAEVAYGDVRKNDPRRVDAVARLAVLADRRGDFPAAESLFAEALKLEPRSVETLSDLGYSHYVHRQDPQAEATLRQAIAIDPKHPRSHANLGLVLARRGDAAAALNEFLAAGCDPSDARSNVGLALAGEGRYAEARLQYAEAIKSKPGSTAARDGIRAVEVALADSRSPKGMMARNTSPTDPAVEPTGASLPALPRK